VQKRIVALLVFGAGLIGANGVMAAGKSGGFNGIWSVQMVTESGICDSSLSYAIAVDKGRVRPLQTSGAPVTVTGRINPDGHVNLAVQRGAAQAGIFGRLQTNSGAGTWQVAGFGCSGRWTAHRRTTTADRS
jgi:hypothetical protein